jgi:hypothetical protein
MPTAAVVGLAGQPLTHQAAAVLGCLALAELRRALRKALREQMAGLSAAFKAPPLSPKQISAGEAAAAADHSPGRAAHPIRAVAAVAVPVART